VYDFLPGQRCISNAELQMGLGTVLSIETRTITVIFLASGKTRTYARQSAPLTRVAFSAGDTIRSHDGTTLKITQVDDEEGLLFYSGTDEKGHHTTLAESALDNFLQLNRPAERLFSGQIDSEKWFELRYLTLAAQNRLSRSDLYGLTGCRTSLITHQLYIAHEVARRYAPRVLLADEVGLGKTIEAGLILHHQLQTERARRVLIIVPETLVHQWLVEMLRRFTLHFKIFDGNRCRDILDDGNFSNIFLSEQLVLCSLDFLCSNEEYFTQCLQAQWDLMVVDEAHHLQYSGTGDSEKYQHIEQLAAQTPGVLLLTATPEQLGKEGHFARLRLLDPDRFPNFARFIAEEKKYQPVAQVVEHLLGDALLDEDDYHILKTTLGEDNRDLLNAVFSVSGSKPAHEARQQIVEHLLDRHGTGRVLFRNTRAAVQGFAQRELIACPLDCDADYLVSTNNSLSDRLHPEQNFQVENHPATWLKTDPRVRWLQQTLNALYPQKVLVIAAHASTALDLTRYLKTHTAIHATAFHEGLSIIERDRAAAFFADNETGSQVLICSEIGSEGRNFQFAHHMVLFDLPINPDLLEQRIGRLDRIGQTQTIRIHVPYIKNSAQQHLFRWYHEGLQAFEHTCPAGHSVYQRVKDQLHALLVEVHNETHLLRFEKLIDETRKYHRELTETLHRGRDRLLEYNSCRPLLAASLNSRAVEQDSESTIANYMDSVFDCFGIDCDIHSEACYIITPTEHMINHFPGLADEGMTITYDRQVALTFEDTDFITWEHPLCSTAMDMVLTNENGNTAVTAIKYGEMKAGSLMLECLFSLEAPPVGNLQTHRYLPPTMIRVLCDERGVDQYQKLSHEQVNAMHQFVETGIGNKIIKAKNRILKAMLKRCEQYGEIKTKQVLALAHKEADDSLNSEINRLRYLSNINSNIRPDEIAFFEQQLASLTQVLDATRLRLDALRVIVVT